MDRDGQLILEYVRDGSQPAFAEIVQRHIDAVYASAWRQTRDAALAEDVTQAVFLMLSRKAAALRPEVILAGWLMTATWYACKNAMRVDRRRKLHEAGAAAMKEETVDPSQAARAMQGEIESELDRALQSLSETDRAAVVMHYFQGREFAEVGAALKTTAEAARKRTERAVAKLRMRFAQAGVELTPAAVGTALSQAGAEKAPSALPAKVIAPPSASAAAIAAAALAMMIAAKLKLAAVGAACVVAIATIAVIVPTMGGAHGTTARAVGRTVGPTTAIDDGSAARNAWIKLTEAMQAGNVAEVINSAYVTDPAYQGFFDQIVETVRLESEFKRSFRARYGDRAAKQLAYSLSHQPRAFTEGRFFPKDVPVRIDGDRAWVNVSDTEVAMVKVGGAWKLTVEWQAGLRGNETQWRRGSLLRDWPRDRPLPPELATDMARLNNEACRRAIKALDEGTLSTPAEVNRFFAQSAFQSVGVIDQRWKASTQPASTRPAAQVARRGSD